MAHWKLCVGNEQNSESFIAKILIKLVSLACNLLILGVYLVFLF